MSKHTADSSTAKPMTSEFSAGLTASLSGVVAPLSAVIKNWMATLSLREQVLVKTLAFIVAVYVAWSIAVAPALISLNKSAIKDQVIQRQWSELLALQSELKTIKSVVPINSTDSSNALQELTAQLGPLCKIVIQDSTARMQIKGVSPEGLSQLLPQIRSRSQAQILEASLRLDTASKLWEGSITLALPNTNSGVN